MTRRLASRLGLVAPSPTVAVKAEADRLRREGVDVVDFGPGEPDLASPPEVKRAGIAAIEDDFTHYTPSAGIFELRQALAEHYSGRASSTIAAHEVAVGAGGKSVLFNLMLGMVNPGDEVLVPSPYWVSFPEQIRLAGGTPVIVPMDPAEGFTLRAGPLAKAAGPATRAIILNAPNNPSGAVLPRDEAERLVDLVVERDLWLVSDDTYESFVYDEDDRISLLEYRDRLGERLVFVSAFSKTWAMTGWRIGYAIAAKPVIDALLKIQSHDTTQACSVSQKAALAALKTAAVDAPRSTIETYRARRDAFVGGLNLVPGVSCEQPRGAFYAFPDVSGLMRRRGLASAAELCAALIREKAVAAVPGEAFGVDAHVRFSYATDDETLSVGLARLTDFAGSG